jgi:hypothetical protein
MPRNSATPALGPPAIADLVDLCGELLQRVDQRH